MDIPANFFRLSASSGDRPQPWQEQVFDALARPDVTDVAVFPRRIWMFPDDVIAAVHDRHVAMVRTLIPSDPRGETRRNGKRSGKIKGSLAGTTKRSPRT